MFRQIGLFVPRIILKNFHFLSKESISKFLQFSEETKFSPNFGINQCRKKTPVIWVGDRFAPHHRFSVVLFDRINPVCGILRRKETHRG